MAKFKVVFHKYIQDSQEFGGDDEHMVSRVFFSLYVGEKRVGDFFADLKQVVGSDIENGDIEVGPPHDYDGPFDHQGFTDAAVQYVRGNVGSNASGIRIGKGVRGIRMRNNTFLKEAEYDF